MTAKLAVLLAQQSQALQMLLEAIRAKYLDAELALVVAEQSPTALLPRLQKARIPLLAYTTETDLLAVVRPYQPDWVVLAGWTAWLNDAFLEQFSYRILHLHLALPGNITGEEALSEALAAFGRGELKQVNVTVQLMAAAQLNRGVTLASQAVPLYRTDTVDLLRGRVQRTASELLVNALRRLIQGDDD